MASSQERCVKMPVHMFSVGTRNRFLELGVIGLCTLILIWPALLNGGYIYFFDSVAYIGTSSTAFDILFDLDNGWSARNAAPPRAGVEEIAFAPRETQPGGEQIVSSGRSLYYGAVLAFLELAGSLWAAILLQGVAVTVAIYMLNQFLFDRPAAATLFAVSALAFLSSAPFFVSYLMPDIFAGIVVLAAGVLIVGGAALGRGAAALWALFLLYGLLCHSGNTAIVLLMLTGCVPILSLARFAISARNLFFLTGAIAAAMAGETFVTVLAEQVGQVTMQRPPFLTARLIDDGPGYAYLVESCPEADFAICRFVGVLPQDSGSILWSTDAATGVYGIADSATKQELSGEQFRFVLSVLAYDPLGQIAASLARTFEQFTRFGLGEFAYTEGLRGFLEREVPPDELLRLRNTAMFTGSFPLAAFSRITQAGTILSAIITLAALLFLRAKRGGVGLDRQPSTSTLKWLFAVVAFGIFCNAAVTGALSEPFDRYQARIVWLVSLFAVLFLWRYLADIRGRGHDLLSVPPALRRAGRDRSRLSVPRGRDASKG